MESDSAPLLKTGSAEGYGTASPVPGSVEQPQIEQAAPKTKATTTTADALGWTGRIIGGFGLAGFMISAIAEVTWPVAAIALGVMATGAGLCITSEIKKECSRPATPFHENSGAGVSANTNTAETPVAVI